MLPEEEFSVFRAISHDFENLIEELSDYAKERHISSGQVAYRYLQSGHISRTLYNRLKSYYYNQYLERATAANEFSRGQNSGPKYNVIRRAYLGELVDVTKRMNLSGVLSTTKAAVVLGVKPLSVHKIFSEHSA